MEVQYTSAVELLESLGLLDWSTLAWGYGRGFADATDLKLFALASFDRAASEELVPLATLLDAPGLEAFQIERALVALTSPNKESADVSADKWRLVKLIQIERLRLELDALADQLEDVYILFGHPVDMGVGYTYGACGLIDEFPRVIANLKARLGVK